MRSERVGDAHVFRVRPIGDDAVTGCESLDSWPRLDDHAGLAIADRDRGIELGAHGAERGADSVSADLVEDLPHLVGLPTRFLEPSGAPEIDEHALRTGRHDARTRLDDERDARGRWHRNVHELRGAVGERLQKMDHWDSIRDATVPNAGLVTHLVERTPAPSRIETTLGMAEYTGKRLLDVLLVLLAAPVWGPLLAIVALLVRLKLGAPVCFSQQRPGRGARPFRLVKFRTMTEARETSGALLPDAERLTSFGRTLRSTSLDELPELWSVLRGDMSLVGPRPLLTRYLPRYNERHTRRHEVRPGITGLAQVSGRNAITWSEKLDLDVEYVERCSLALDIRILWRTLRSVARREGITAEGAATMPEFTGYDQPSPR